MSLRQKGRHRVQTTQSGGWITTFSDLISLLLTFFILIVSMSTLDDTPLVEISSHFNRAVSVLNSPDKAEVAESKPRDLLRPVTPREMMLAMRQKSDAILRNTTLEHKVKAVVIKDQLLLRVDDAVLFASGSAKLQPESRNALRGLAMLLRQAPGQIRVEGHTDKTSEGGTQDPWSLSLARAASVLHVLEDAGVEPQRLSLAGYGPSKPLSIEYLGFGSSQNRRVDIILYQED